MLHTNFHGIRQAGSGEEDFLKRMDRRRTVDDGRTDGRRLDVYTISSPEPISSPCEPNGSGELITQPVLAPRGRPE